MTPWIEGVERRQSYTGVTNAITAIDFLLRHPTLGTEALESALDSDDVQQRFFAAYLLAATGRSAHAERLCEILVPNLRGDDLPGNACMACYALTQIGPPALPFVRGLTADPDPQMREAANLILLDIRDPPETEAELEVRGRINDLSEVVHDPCVEQVIESSAFDVLYIRQRNPGLFSN
jgi:hypothetical protein